MNTFYLYTMSLEDYESIATDTNLNPDKRRLKLNNHLLISGTNRRIVTQLMLLNGQNLTKPSKLGQADFSIFSLRYEQVMESVLEEMRLAAGHFSHTIHKVNMAAFYYLSFSTHRELCAVVIKDEPEGVSTRSWEGHTPAQMNRFSDTPI